MTASAAWRPGTIVGGKTGCGNCRRWPRKRSARTFRRRRRWCRSLWEGRGQAPFQHRLRLGDGGGGKHGRAIADTPTARTNFLQFILSHPLCGGVNKAEGSMIDKQARVGSRHGIPVPVTVRSSHVDIDQRFEAPVGLPADTFEDKGFVFHSIGDKYLRAVAEGGGFHPDHDPGARRRVRSRGVTRPAGRGDDDGSGVECASAALRRGGDGAALSRTTIAATG